MGKQQQPTSILEKLTSKQQPKSKQQQSTSEEQQLTKQQTSKLTGKQQSTAKQQQLTSQQPENGVQQVSKGQQYQQTDQKQQLQQTKTEKLDTNKQHQEMTEHQQKEHVISNHSNHSSVNSNDIGPASLVEPMENNHAGTMDAWQSEQTHQKVIEKSKIVEDDHTKTSVNERIHDSTSPISSESVTSDDGHHALHNDDTKLQQRSNQVPSTYDPSRLTPKKRAISVDVLSPTEASKAPVFFGQEHSTPLRPRSETVIGEPRKKAPPIPVNKSPITQSKKSISSHSSLGNLRRPVSIASAPGSNSSGMTYHGKFDILGVLRVRLRGVSIPDHTTELTEAPPPAAVHQLKGRSISVGAMAIPEATHGIYCIFTINGGNTSAKSETCKILPYRPVLWEENEKEKLFFTNHSRQLFILCRKVPLLKKKSKSKASSEVCVGASVMKIIEINPTLLQQDTLDYTSTDGLQWYNKTLPLQPKGEIELSVSFEGKQLRENC